MVVHSFDSPIDAVSCRSDGLVVVCMSNVFGNTWDGGISLIQPGMFGHRESAQWIPTPSGCTDVSFVGPAGTTIAVSCDDGNVAIYSISGRDLDGVPVKLLTDHENAATAVCSSSSAPENILSASMDTTIVHYKLDGGDVTSVHEYKGMLKGCG
jgi:WD40 repeat protein